MSDDADGAVCGLREAEVSVILWQNAPIYVLNVGAVEKFRGLFRIFCSCEATPETGQNLQADLLQQSVIEVSGVRWIANRTQALFEARYQRWHIRGGIDTDKRPKEDNVTAIIEGWRRSCERSDCRYGWDEVFSLQERASLGISSSRVVMNRARYREKL